MWAAEGAPRAGAATAPRRRQSVARRFCDPGGVGTRDPDPTKAAASSPGDLRPASSTLIRDLGYYSRLADDTFASGGRAGAVVAFSASASAAEGTRVARSPPAEDEEESCPDVPMNNVKGRPRRSTNNTPCVALPAPPVHLGRSLSAVRQLGKINNSWSSRRGVHTVAAIASERK